MNQPTSRNEREIEVLRAERDRWQASYFAAVKHLTHIYGLTNPPTFETAGKTYRFENPRANETLQALSDAIRAIPEELRASASESGPRLTAVDRFVAETRMERGEMLGYESTLLGTLREYAKILDLAERNETDRLHRALAAPSAERASNPADEEYHALLGTLAALDVVIVSHDQPVIASEIIRAAGPKKVMEAAKRSGYPFMKELRKVYKGEGLDGK